MGQSSSSPAPAAPPRDEGVMIAPPVTAVPPKKFSKGAAPADMKVDVSSSKGCTGCIVGFDSGITTSVVVLSRNIMGKIPIAVRPYPPSNLPQDATENGSWYDHGGNRHEDYARDIKGKAMSGTTRDNPDGQGCRTCMYNPPFPGQDYPEVLSKADVKKLGSGLEYSQTYAAQSIVEDANRRKIDALNNLHSQRVMIWNPSDDPSDPNSSIAVNYISHGGLTKLYLKPPLPFSINYSGF